MMKALAWIVMGFCLWGCSGEPFTADDVAFGSDSGIASSNDGGVGADAPIADDASSMADAHVSHDGAIVPPPADAHDAGTPSTCDGTCMAIPNGWAGPVELSVGTSPPTCGPKFAGSQSVLHDDLVALPATCDCSCGAPSGATCTVNFGGHCQAAPGTCDGPVTPYGTSSGCMSMSVWCSSIDISTPSVTGGACAPNATKNVPAPTWSTTAISCAPTSTSGCLSGSACVPDADPQFHLCVEHDGDVACPSGFPSRTVAYADVDDARDCSMCSCGAPTGVGCTGSVSMYSDGACTSVTKGGYPTPNCISESGAFIGYDGTATGGSCSASSVSPTGTATPASPTTLCCQ